MRFEDGRPVANALLRDTDGFVIAATDRHGIARVEAVDRTSLHRREALGEWRQDDRRLWAREWVELPAEPDVLILWSGGRTLRGRVIDQEDRPVANARLRVWSNGGEVFAQTDLAGRFEVRATTPSALHLSLEHPDCFKEVFPQTLREGRPGDALDTTIRAVRGRHHRVRLRSTAGAVVAADVNWKLQWKAPDGSTLYGGYSVTTDAQGLADVLLDPAAAMELAISPGVAYRSRTVRGLPGLLPDTLELELRCERVRSWIPIRLRDASSGEALEAGRVLLRRADQPWIVGEPPTSTDTAVCHPSSVGEDFGVLDVTDVPDGLWEVWCWVPGYAPRTAFTTADEAGVYPPPDLRLQPGGGTLRVQVGARWSARVTSATWPWAGTPEAFLHAANLKGALEFDDAGQAEVAVPPGEYAIDVWWSDETRARTTVRVGTGDVTVDLRR